MSAAMEDLGGRPVAAMLTLSQARALAELNADARARAARLGLPLAVVICPRPGRVHQTTMVALERLGLVEEAGCKGKGVRVAPAWWRLTPAGRAAAASPAPAAVAGAAP